MWESVITSLCIWLPHWCRDKFAAMSQMTFSTAFSWMKMCVFRLTFHWNLFLKFESTISQLWFQKMDWRRLGDKSISESTMASLLMHICVTRSQWVNELRCWFSISSADMLQSTSSPEMKWFSHFKVIFNVYTVDGRTTDRWTNGWTKPLHLERVRIASMGHGNTRYPGQLKSYLRGENNKTWNTQMAICIYHQVLSICNFIW